MPYMQDPRGLEERVEVFLEQFEKDLQKMSDEDFKVSEVLSWFFPPALMLLVCNSTRGPPRNTVIIVCAFDKFDFVFARRKTLTPWLR